MPAHSFKFAAALQAAQSCDNPVLIRIETKAGHGAGKPTAKLIDEAADQWAFLVKVLRIDAVPEGAVRAIHHFDGPSATIPASNRDHGPHFISLISPRIHWYSG